MNPKRRKSAPALKESRATVRAFFECRDIARRASQAENSAHLLLAFFTFPNRAAVLLRDKNIDEEMILDLLRVLEDEPPGTVQRLRERAKEIARGSSGEDVDCLHVLIALLRFRDAFAYKLLERTGVSITGIRNQAVSFVTGVLPRRYRSLPQPPPAQRFISPPRNATRTQTKVVGKTKNEAPRPVAKTKALPKKEEASKTPVTQQKIGASPKAQTQSQNSEVFDLQSIAPTLADAALDLSARAEAGALDRVVGRESELEQIIDILGKRRSNNPILVGPPGVGKTALVEGLAKKIAEGDTDVCHLHNRRIIALDVGSIIAGTSLRGALSERLKSIKDEVRNADGKLIIFMDEIHTLIGAGGSGDGGVDAANDLKTALARGEFPCIGATTEAEYKKYFEKDPALERRFSPVDIDEPSCDEAILILESAIVPYSAHHGVEFSLESIHAAVTLSHRYVHERRLPDKAFAVLDLAGSRAKRRGQDSVELVDVAKVIHEWSQVPLERLIEADLERFADSETWIAERFVGHQDVVHRVSNVVRRGYAGLTGQRPMGSLLFLGPTGVGKTELAKVLAEFLFGDRDAIVRFDMSEMTEAHSVARLLGAQPGYVGHEHGGQLTEALRKRPFQIVLFDEIEKAHPDVLNILLQLMDEGHVTDTRGRRVSFSNTVVILTSNLGADAFGASKQVGFGQQTSAQGSQEEAVLERAREQLIPELWSRFDDKLVFLPLERIHLERVARLMLARLSTQLFADRELSLSFDESVVNTLLDAEEVRPESGARGLRAAIQRLIEAPLAEKILREQVQSGDHIQVALPELGGFELSRAS